jgi:predicted adenine nucleotide alpha hydrolase (AANH) superfamily ATPase
MDFQSKLDNILEDIDKNNKPLLFLHCCCAPCSSYVLEYLNEYFDIIVYFYNPNIDTEEEYYKRARELEMFVGKSGVKISDLIIEDYNHNEFLTAIKGHENEKEGSDRCKKCFELRLKKTLETVIQYLWTGKKTPTEKIYFCTTLSISPLKNAAVINEIGNLLASTYKEKDGDMDIDFLPSDFKKKEGYKRSCELSKEYGLYRQDYCGCEFSKSGRVNDNI